MGLQKVFVIKVLADLKTFFWASEILSPSILLGPKKIEPKKVLRTKIVLVRKILSI